MFQKLKHFINGFENIKENLLLPHNVNYKNTSIYKT